MGWFPKSKDCAIFFHFWGIVQYTTHQKTNCAHAKSWQGDAQGIQNGLGAY